MEIEREELHLNVQEKIQVKADIRGKGEVESQKFLKESLLQVTDEVCSQTKGPERYRESWR